MEVKKRPVYILKNEISTGKTEYLGERGDKRGKDEWKNEE